MKARELKKTIKNLRKTFTANNLTFDEKEKNFWDMLNDKEILQAITSAMKQKIQKKNPVQEYFERRMHC